MRTIDTDVLIIGAGPADSRIRAARAVRGQRDHRHEVPGHRETPPARTSPINALWKCSATWHRGPGQGGGNAERTDGQQTSGPPASPAKRSRAWRRGDQGSSGVSDYAGASRRDVLISRNTFSNRHPRRPPANATPTSVLHRTDADNPGRELGCRRSSANAPRHRVRDPRPIRDRCDGGRSTVTSNWASRSRPDGPRARR